MIKNVFLIDEQDGSFYNNIADYMDQRDYLGVGSSFCSEQNRYLTAKNLENLTVGFWHIRFLDIKRAMLFI